MTRWHIHIGRRLRMDSTVGFLPLPDNVREGARVAVVVDGDTGQAKAWI